MNRRALVLNIFAGLFVVFCVLVFAFIQTTPDINNYDDDDDDDGIYEPIVTASNTSKVVELPPQPANTQVVKERRVGLLAEVNWRHLIKTVSVFLVGLCALGILVYGLYKGFLALKECLDRVESVTETIDYEAQLREELGIVGSSGDSDDGGDAQEYEDDSDSINTKTNWYLTIIALIFVSFGLGSLYLRHRFGKTPKPSPPKPKKTFMTIGDLPKNNDGPVGPGNDNNNIGKNQAPSKADPTFVPFAGTKYKLGSKGPVYEKLKDQLFQQATRAAQLQKLDATKYEQEKTAFMTTCKEAIGKVDDDQFKEMGGVLAGVDCKSLRRAVEEFPELACFIEEKPDFSKMTREQLTPVLAVYYFLNPMNIPF